MQKRSKHALLACACAMLLGLASVHARADDAPPNISGKLLLTAGVSNIEGSAGGGLTPWALIGGYETNDQIGANAFYTRLSTQDYSLNDAGCVRRRRFEPCTGFAVSRLERADIQAWRPQVPQFAA